MFEFPLKIFNVLGAALLHYYWLIFAPAASLTQQRSLASQHKLYIYSGDPKFQFFFPKTMETTTAGFPDRSTREDSVELCHENTAGAVCKTLVLQLTATRGSVTGNFDVRQQSLWLNVQHRAQGRLSCPVLPRAELEDWTESKIFYNRSLSPGSSINFILTFLHK